MNIPLVLICVSLALSFVVLWHGICAVNEMTRATPHGPRIAVVLVTSGAFANVLRGVEGIPPSGPEMLLLAGMALLISSNCWRGICPCVITLKQSATRKPSAPFEGDPS